MNSNFDFDLGLGSNRPKSLNDQKNKSSSSSSSSSYQQQSKPAWQPNKTSWAHQPAPAQNPLAPSSMVGDIFGKSWASTTPAVSSTPINVVNKNPNLFGDLVSSAMGGKSNSGGSVPLKNVAPAKKGGFSVGNMADSLPKTAVGGGAGGGGNWGGVGNSGGGFSNGVKMNNGVNANANKGGASMGNMGGGGGIGGGIGSKKDPFGSLFDLASKPSVGVNVASKVNVNKTSVGVNVASNGSNRTSVGNDDGFGDFQNAVKSSTFGGGVSSNENNTMGDAFSGFRDFGMPVKQSPVQPSGSSGNDPLDMFFPSGAGSTAPSNGGGVQQSSEIDDWGTEFGGGVHDVGGSTTELEGLPPPPSGVSACTAKSKGMDNYKQGQYPDAIKWLSWAVVILEKAADRAAVADVLSSRASCYKEVGEYKKAVADCTKVLEQDDANVSVLVQRALLYESMEKYKLGAEDLRTVLRLDPGNRIARSTIHRLAKLAD